MPYKGSISPSTKLANSTAFAPNGRMPWREEEIELVMADNSDDFALSKKLGRSINAIRIRRCITKKKRAR